MKMATRDEPRVWNAWWTVTVVAAAFTVGMLLLEGFGILHDWGLVLGGIGIVVTLIGSAQAATHSAVARLDRRFDQMHDTLLHMLRILDTRLPDSR